MKKLSLSPIFVAFICLSTHFSFAQQAEPSPGIQTDLMDTSVSPADDFFRFVNGRWLDKTDIPADRTRWGSFDELRKKTNEQTLDVLNSAIESNKFPISSAPGKAAFIYKLALDSAQLEQQDIEPIKTLLNQISNINSVAEVLDFQKETLPIRLSNLLYASIGSNPKNSNQKVVYIGGGSLGLPDRDYYLEEDEDSVERRTKYKAHVARMLGFIGYKPAMAKKAAQEILDFETQIAKTKLDKVARRDPYKRYNPRSFEQLKTLLPQVNWDLYFAKAGMTKPDTVIISEVAYIDHLNKVLANAEIKQIKHYLNWQLIDNTASYLSPTIGKANWEFYSKELRGAKQQRKLEERALRSTNRLLGEAVGMLYVDKYFPAEAKEKAVDMVENLKKAYETRIKNLSWMSEETKVKALEKLYSFRVKIAYPDEWKNYEDLELMPLKDGGSYWSNVAAIRTFNFEDEISKAKQPVDKDEWFMSPQTVNAYYNPTFNEIVFPAAILQPPFYNYQADAAVNYGGIGAVIGHEISHGFDDKGSQYDKNGNLNSWWTDSDRKAFDALNDKLVAQFSAYEPLPGVFVNGEFTLGENIGDLGGVNSAYDALQLHFKDNPKPGKIDGYTAEQRFFISWGSIWRSKYRDEALENQVKTDPHSPGMYRASGPLINLESFYQAFNISPTHEKYLAPKDRIVIW